MSEVSLQRKHIITIAGKPGSGKSTTSKGVAVELGYQHFSSGDLFRAISNEKGLDLLSGNAHAEKDAAIDHLVDQRLRDIGATEDSIVIDSRMAWHWMPYSFKVYLNLDMKIAAERILKNINPERLRHENIPSDPADYANELTLRFESEARRYEKLYGVNPYDLKQYDLVVDTSTNNIEESIALVLDHYREWIKLN